MKNDETHEKTYEYGSIKTRPADQFEFDYEPIRGYPELRWTGKRPFKGTSYFPAQLKESHGDSVDGWRNKLYWGDNLQVMSHLLRDFRGKVKLIYIDPPFDSKADYKKKIELRGTSAESDTSAFEEKQYSDIWTNDEYLQFIYERLILMRELLADDGSIFVHLDWNIVSHIKVITDEIFGPSMFRNAICWKSSPGHSDAELFGQMQNVILFYSKGSNVLWNQQYQPYDEEYLSSHYQKEESDGRKYEDADLTAYGLSGGGYSYEWNGVIKLWRCPLQSMKELEKSNRIYYTKNGVARYKRYLDEMPGAPLSDLWLDIARLNSQAIEKENYPTQKPEALLSRIITTSSNPGDLVFDCFMGSGTTQAVALKLGRRFLGADINLGAIQTTTKRLLGVVDQLSQRPAELAFGPGDTSKIYKGFEVYTVNHYDFFRNELEARELLIEALELQKLPGNMLWDGESDGWMVKILAVNRLATAADLNPLLSNLDYKAW
jgi:site-specific DNA-methyltransferase (adenine-specific)/adenine-specific DNA-methyltransferase